MSKLQKGTQYFRISTQRYRTQSLDLIPIMLLKVCCLICIVGSRTTGFLVQNDLQILESQLSECLWSIAGEYFPQDALVLLQTPELECKYNDLNYIDSTLQVLVKKNNYQMLISRCFEQDLKRTTFQTAVLVLVVDEQANIEICQIFGELTLMRILFYHNSNNLRIVIVSPKIPISVQEQEETALSLINGFRTTAIDLEVMSKIELIVLMPQVGWSASTKKYSAIDIYGWHKSEQNDPCFHELNKVSLLDQWFSDERAFLRNEDLFPYNAFTHHHTCTLHVVVVEEFIPYFFLKTDGDLFGIYFIVFDIIEKTKNIKIEYHTNESEYYDAKGIEFLDTSKFYGEHSYAYLCFKENLYFYVPLIHVPRWQGLIRVFSGFVWLSVIISFLLGMVILWLLDKYVNRKDVSITDAFLNTLRTYIAMGIQFDCKGLVSTSFFILWLFYCMQIYTAYTTFLITFLTYPGECPLVHSSVELRQSSYEIWNTEYIPTPQNEIEFMLMSYQYCELQFCIFYLGEEQNIALIGRSYLKYFLYLTKLHGRATVIRLDEPALENYIHFSFKNPLLLEHFDKFMGWLISSGIPYQFIKQIDEIGNNFVSEDNASLKPMTLSELQGPFYFLVISLVMCLVFITENINARRRVCIF